jgi:tetratricopeptide (TPR) repeat protein
MKRKRDYWTPALIILVILHLILITAIFTIHAKRRCTVQKQKQSPHAQYSHAVALPDRSLSMKEREKQLKKTIAQNHHDIRSYQELGAIYKSRGRYKDAIAVMREALENEPERVDLHLEIGVLYYSNSATVDKAIAHFKKVLEIDPHHRQKKVIRIWIKRGKELKGRRKISVTELKKLLVKNPENAALHYQIGMRYVATPQTELQAITHLEKVLQLTPKHKNRMEIMRVLRRLRAIKESK